MNDEYAIGKDVQGLDARVSYLEKMLAEAYQRIKNIEDGKTTDNVPARNTQR